MTPASPVRQSCTREPEWFTALAVSLFVGLGLIATWYHEMWRDELQAWLIAAGSSSMAELLGNIRYEGHPALWYVCLYALARVWTNPAAMQVFHLTVAACAAYFFARFSPFTKVQKLCFLFGYFFFFEYGIISRHYVLGLAAMMAFCALQDSRRPHVALNAVLLVLLANTSIYGAIIAFAFGIYCITRIWTHADVEPATHGYQVALSVFVIGLGIIASISQVMPPSDMPSSILNWHTEPDVQRLETILSAVWNSYVPIPIPKLHFWNTNILEALGPVQIASWQLFPARLQMLLSLGLIVLSAWVLRRTPVAFVVFIVAVTEFLAFSYLKHYGGLRHAGHLFMVFVCCLWLSRYDRPRATAHDSAGAMLLRPAGTFLLSFLFAIQAFGGLFAVLADLRHPFSASKDAAKYIKEQHLADVFMIGSEHYAATAVAAHLNRPILLAEPNRIGTYVIWRNDRHAVSAAELLRRARSHASHEGRDVLIIANYNLGEEGLPFKLKSFQDSIVEDERYVLYLIRPAGTTGSREIRTTFTNSNPPS